MKRVVLLAPTVAATIISVPAPAPAQRFTNSPACEQWRHGRCISWHGHSEPRASGYSIGDSFGPRQHFVDLSALPERIVTRYHLGPNFRYVSESGRVYVVSPRTDRVVRVISVP